MYLQALHDLEILCVKFNLLQLNCDDMNKVVSVTVENRVTLRFNSFLFLFFIVLDVYLVD